MLTNKLSDIRSIFDVNHSFVRDPSLPSQTTILELEAKYGFYSGKNFNSTVPYIHYERLMSRLRQLPLIPETIEESQVSQLDDIRRITTIHLGNIPETVEWQRKRRVSDINVENYDIRISANIEETIQEKDIPKNFKPTTIRDRTRHSFILLNNLVKVDMTSVMMRGKDNIIRPIYEVEVEFLGTKDQLNIFLEKVEYIFKMLRGTNIIYTTDLKNQLISDTISILGGSRDNMIDKSVLVEARNIKSRDLVYGAIVGNDHILNDKILSIPRRSDKPSNGSNYMITFKADGLRKMLIIHTSGIWLVYPPYEFNLTLNSSSGGPQVDTLLKTLTGTILDGELVIPHVPNNIAYWYLGFDCLSFRGKAGIQKNPYTERQKIVNAIAGAIKTPILTVDTKDTEEIKSPSDFFRLVREFLDKRDSLPYQEDGLIFVPIDTFYNPRSQDYPLHERSLSSIPDICKWKKSTDITIDFSIKWLPGNLLDLQVYDELNSKTIPFRGTTINPITSDMIDHTNPLTKDKHTDTVVEYEWVSLPGLSVNRRPNGIFRPRRIRPEKSGPNRLAIALDDWEDIMNPIAEKEIRGETLKMAFGYHNRIKKGLYSLLTKQDKKKNIGVNIIDIGSGWGGDTAKWKQLRDRENPTNTGFVVAVEPNINNRKELRSRIETFELNDRVIVVETGGEDTVEITKAVRENIPGGKVDAVTLMLSMSFFWASNEHLDALVKTIVTNLKEGGKIIFLTIDGDVVEQLFEPALGGKYKEDINILDAKMHLYGRSEDVKFGRALDFSLSNTIVGDQREYLVHIQDFTLRLEKYGITLYEIHRAEGEKLLSESNSLYSSMYSYGYYVKDMKHGEDGGIVANIILPTIPTPTKMDNKVVILPAKSPRKDLNLPLIPILPESQKLYEKVADIKLPAKSPRKDLPLPLIPILPEPQKLYEQYKKPNKYEIENNQLTALTVTYIGKKGELINGAAINDDTYAPLKCTWYDNLIRIATIGDGSCFVHAVLKGFYPSYQENNDARYRLDLVANLRRDLGVGLSLENDEYPGYTYWETTARGSFVRMVMQEINYEDLIGELRVDYSLAGLQRLFNSTSQLGDEVYTYVSEVLKVDIYVLRGTSDDLYPHYNTRKEGVVRPAVVVVGNTYHYEVVGINKADGIQTLFLENDPFLEAISKLFIGDTDFDDINNKIKYNPDQGFIDSFVDTFTNQNGLNIPPVVYDIFPESDPFRMMLSRLMDVIIEESEVRAKTLRIGVELGKNPIIIQLEEILKSMKGNEEINMVRDIVENKIIADIHTSLLGILSEAETDGLLSHNTVKTIISLIK